MVVITPRRRAEQLRVQCNDVDAQEILAEAIDKLPGFYVPRDIPAADRRLPIGIASLAIGDREFSRALFEHLEGAGYLLLAARHYLWSGEDHVLREQLLRLDLELQQVPPFVELHELAIALESIGATAEASAVRARSANAQRRILPDFDAQDCNEFPAASPAHTVNTFMHTHLGVAPDAARGRLRMRVCLPDWIDEVTVDNIRMADALITMRYKREGVAHQYSVEQVAGAMPVRLIFEPTFTAAVTAAHVDDVAADLNVQPHGQRVIAPLQIMLDNRRSIRFETNAGNKP
jgi:hypothetical protein